MQLCELDVTYNNKTTRVAALVMPFLSEQLILGMDFLRQRQCQLRIDINAMVIEETNEAEMSPPTPSTSDSDANVNTPQSAGNYTSDYLFAGIVIQPPKKYQRRLQFVIHREGRPLIQVTILNKTLARLRSMGQEKLVEMLPNFEN